MSTVAVQPSFNSGEWSPQMRARVDLQKHRTGAARLKNFFADYRGGGASTRPGTKYVLRAKDSANEVRLIRFQITFNLGYVLEFGNGYIRFIYNGSYILETAINITGATQSDPCNITAVGHSYNVGDWVYITGVGGMTELNNKFYIVGGTAPNVVSLKDLDGNDVDSSAFTAYTSGGTIARVYTLASPYVAGDSFRLLKFTQEVDKMIICHPSHPPYELQIVSSNNWTLTSITIGSTVSAPAQPVISSTLAYGSGNIAYSYGVTAIDANGQESSMSDAGNMLSTQSIRSVAGTNKVTWPSVSDAVAYNVYMAQISYFGVIPYGAQYGFIGSSKGTTFIDTNITQDFSQTPPIATNPFKEFGVNSVTVTAPGTYTTVPTVTFSGGGPIITATGYTELQVQGTPTISAGGGGYAIGDTLQFDGGVLLRVTNVAAGAITAWTVLSAGSVTSGSVPASPTAPTSGGITSGSGATATMTWGVQNIIMTETGSNYGSAPTVVFSAGAAAATATIATTGVGYVRVPAFYQQRLVFGCRTTLPQTFYMSKPGAYFNFDVSKPVNPSDAITGTLVSGTLNTIMSMVPTTAGLLILGDNSSWLLNGGSAGTGISPTTIVANPQSYVGANDMPPILANYDILYFQSKGPAVRDMSYNIYTNVFTGVDISVISSHLFFGYSFYEWAWVEQPFYTARAIRNDGILLSLTYIKEQEYIAWTWYETSGNYVSIAAVTEDTATMGSIDVAYYVVERVVNGQTLKYIEREAERIFPNGKEDAWCVDCAVYYSGSPATSFSGGEHLAGLTCTGLADGEIIAPFVMPANGQFALATAASKVVVGLGYNCDLQTLELDVGDPSVQGKVKKIPSVTVRVADALGLSIGNDFDHLTPMKDLVDGAVSSMLTGQAVQVVSDLVSGDARTFLTPAYTVPGQYCIRQSNPYPATILGVFPTIIQGDDP